MPLVALLLAVALAAAVTAAVPALLRWCPIPDDEPDGPEAEQVPPFVSLATPRFRATAFACASIAAATAFLLTPPALWAVWAPLATLGVLLVLVDLHTTFLPLRLTYLAVGLTVVGAAGAAWLLRDWTPLVWGVAGGIGCAAWFAAMWWLGRGRMGFGDVRLAGLLGLVAGATSPMLVIWALLLGTLAAAMWGLVARWRRGRDAPFPYGPGLALGPFLALVLSWVLRLG